MASKIREEDLRLNIIVNGDDGRKKIKEAEDAFNDWQESIRKTRAEMAELERQGKQNTVQYDNLKKRLDSQTASADKAKQRLDALTRRMNVNTMTIGELRKHVRNLSRELNQMDPRDARWKKLNAELQTTKNRLHELTGVSRGIQGVFDKLGFGKIEAAVGKLFVYYNAIKGIFSLFTGGINKIREFEQANVNLSTILGVHVSQMTGLTKSALELGRTTEYTASQVTNLQTELAKLGFNQPQILQMTKPVLQFATAVGANLPEAAALAGATLRAFDKDVSETDDVLATMVVGCNKSALSFEYLQTAMSIVGPVAKTFRFDVKDTIALLGTLANSGFDASSAATATRNILLNLADANGKLAKELGQPIRSLPDLIDGLQRLDAKGIDLAKTLDLTDKRSVAAFNTFLRGAGAMGELRDSLQDVDGELKRIQEERLNSVEGSVKLLQSAWEGLMLSFYNSKRFIKAVIDGITGLIEGVTKLIGPSESLIDQFDQQLDRVATLESTIPPLVSEYETLRSKTELNADEHERLKTVTKELADAYPGAISAVDEYGNAIEVNTEKINRFLESERARLKYVYADSIKDLEKEVEKQQQIIENAQSQIERGTTYTGGSLGGDIGRMRDLTSEEVAALQRNIAHAQEIRQGALAQLKRLNGQELEEMISAQNERREAEKAAAEEEKKQREEEERLRQEKQAQQAAAAAAYKNLDEKEIAERIALRKKFLDGEIATEKEYNDQLLQLNIDSLNRRLNSGELKGKERLKVEEQLTTLLLQQKKQEQKDLEEIEKQRIDSITDPVEKEEALYAQQQKKYAGNTAMLEQLARSHARKLTEIKLKQALDALKTEENRYKQERDLMVNQQKEELSLATLTAAQRKKIKKQQIEELKAFDTEYYTEMLTKVRTLFSEGQIDIPTAEGLLKSIDLDSELLSDEEKRQLQEMIDTITAKLAAAKDTVKELGYSFTTKQGDILGFSQDDWGLFFENISSGKAGADELKMALTAAAEAADMAMTLYSGYDKMMTAKENASLKKFKKNQDERKKSMENRLDAGLMTQEQYDAETERMDEEYDKKQEELEIKQAKRQKAQNLAQATIATARAVAEALPNLFLAAIAGAMGAAQIAMIAATPIAGAEEGGLLVARTQDGRKFQASVEPDKRGYVERPTVITGENGLEYIIPNEAMKNPTARPIIGLFETVRRQGNLADFNFGEVLPALYNIPGRAAGGAISPGQAIDTINASPTVSTASEGSDPALVRLLYTAVVRLTERLDEPIRADVSLMGKAGLIEKQREYERMMNRGKLK
jgi:TP901 family phage tail tape measure protein